MIAKKKIKQLVIDLNNFFIDMLFTPFFLHQLVPDPCNVNVSLKVKVIYFISLFSLSF